MVLLGPIATFDQDEKWSGAGNCSKLKDEALCHYFMAYVL
jgi:hypothetical protein